MAKDDLFAEYAAQYYVAGRLAARAELIPIYGNLLHHAVEMFLKTALLEVVDRKELRKYSHGLERLWRRYKQMEADPALDRFDSAIHALHEFEELRYPDAIPGSATLLPVTWKPRRALVLSRRARMKMYGVFISEVDHLVSEIVKRASINPKHFTVMATRSARGALRYQAPPARCWLRKRP